MTPRAHASRRDLLRGALAVTGIAAIGGAARRDVSAQATPAAAATKARQSGGKPVVALSRLPAADALFANGELESLWIASLCHDALFMPNTSGTIVGGIAIAPAMSANQRELTFSVRSGVVFPDGQLLTAHDVLASLERVRRLGSAYEPGWRLEHIGTIVAIDDATVRITLTQPDSAIVACLATPAIPILPRRVAETVDVFGLANLPDGSGPFTPDTTPNASTYEVTRNAAFWQIGRPHLDGVTITSIPEDTQRTIALVTGSVDLVVDVPLLDVPSLQQDPNITLVGGSSTRACVLIPNLTSGPMADRRMRQLLSGAIDREALVHNVAVDAGTAEQTIFPKASWAGLDEPPEHPDAKASVVELRALGYVAGLPLRLIARETDGSAASAAVLLQEQLAYAGFAVTLDLLDDVTLQRAIATKTYDLHITYLPPWGDPHELLRPYLMSDGAQNVMGFRSTRVDRLIRRGILTFGQEHRAAIYRQLQEILLEELPLIVLFFPNYYDAMTSRITDYGAYPPGGAYGVRAARMETSVRAS